MLSCRWLTRLGFGGSPSEKDSGVDLDRGCEHKLFKNNNRQDLVITLM